MKKFFINYSGGQVTTLTEADNASVNSGVIPEWIKQELTSTEEVDGCTCTLEICTLY